VYIRYLRNKIDKGFEPALILTRWGEGYMLRSEDDPPPTKDPKDVKRKG
ncbi:MAG: helix-turn-helix domain-containing protein, partial [Planctomycetia bacterium]|nr:helix-turn-helix domain-containing protein [Planctomycetia bacterium]